MVAPLWPTLPSPDPARPRPPTQPRYRKAPAWDYAIGDFRAEPSNRIVEAEGHRASLEWSVKCCVTQRGWYPVYSDRYGVDMAGAFGVSTDAIAFALLADEITSALLADPRNDAVDDFAFAHLGESVQVSFTIRMTSGPTERISVEITPG